MHGERIKELRKSAGYSREYLGELLGVKESSISAYEREVREPNIKSILALSKIFNIDIDYILGNDVYTKTIIKTNKIELSNYPTKYILKELANRID